MDDSHTQQIQNSRVISFIKKSSKRKITADVLMNAKGVVLLNTIFFHTDGSRVVELSEIGNQPHVLFIDDVVKTLKCSVHDVLRFMKSSELPYYAIATNNERRFLFLRDQVDSWRANHIEEITENVHHS